MSKENNYTYDEQADYKDIERILFNYKEIPHKIKRYEIEIKMLGRTYEGLKGKSHNEIKETTPTNMITSSVENALTNKETKIERLKDEIETLQLTKEMVENAFNSLSRDEKGVIASRYFDKVTVSNMAYNLDITEDGIYKACRRIIENKLSKYIIV